MTEHRAQDERTLQNDPGGPSAAGPQSGSPITDSQDPPQPEEHVVTTEKAVTSLEADEDSVEVTTEDLRTAPPGGDAVTDEG